MNLKHMMMIGMLSTASLLALTPTASAGEACNNYGVGFSFWIGDGNCNVQECYMGTGAAAGAGAAGAAGNEGIGAEASAGGSCEQGGGGSDGGLGFTDDVGFSCLETTSIATPENQYQVNFQRRC